MQIINEVSEEGEESQSSASDDSSLAELTDSESSSQEDETSEENESSEEKKDYTVEVDILEQDFASPEDSLKFNKILATDLEIMPVDEIIT